MTAAGYNRFHDQLLLSASTDGAVKLWRAASISSAPPAEYELDGALGDDGDGDADGLVKEYALGRVSDFWGASRARSQPHSSHPAPPSLFSSPIPTGTMSTSSPSSASCGRRPTRGSSPRSRSTASA